MGADRRVCSPAGQTYEVADTKDFQGQSGYVVHSYGCQAASLGRPEGSTFLPCRLPLVNDEQICVRLVTPWRRAASRGVHRYLLTSGDSVPSPGRPISKPLVDPLPDQGRRGGKGFADGRILARAAPDRRLEQVIEPLHAQQAIVGIASRFACGLDSREVSARCPSLPCDFCLPYHIREQDDHPG